MLKLTCLAIALCLSAWALPSGAAVSASSTGGAANPQSQPQAASEVVPPPDVPADIEYGDAEPTQSGPPSLFDDPQQPLDADHAAISVRLHTANHKEALDVFTLYPYIVKPPVCLPLPKLPLNYQYIKRMSMNLGYMNRPNFDKPYQNPNWRFVYAYKVALAKSGLSEPHTIFTHYQFAEEMVPWVWKECKVRNAFEKQRQAKYDAAIEEWERTHVDAENAAVNAGLAPIKLKHRQINLGVGQFPAGTWWLQVTRKTPGLQFYWLKPITAVAGQKLDINLNENDALAILGAW